MLTVYTYCTYRRVYIPHCLLYYVCMRVMLVHNVAKLLQALNYMRMSSRIDAVSARVQTAITMRQVCM